MGGPADAGSCPCYKHDKMSYVYMYLPVCIASKSRLKYTRYQFSRRRTAIKPAKRQSQRQPFINLLRLTVANRTRPSARVQRAAACASPTNYHDVGITGHSHRQTAYIPLPSFQPVGGDRKRQTTRTHRALPHREVRVGFQAGIAIAEIRRQTWGLAVKYTVLSPVIIE